MALVVLTATYLHYKHIVDERVERPIFNVPAQIYGLPGLDGKPQLITGMFDAKHRSKRLLLTYNQIPQLVIDAIVSVEDRRFFEHKGINYVRLVEGVAAPLFGHGRMQGGSTLTMQMARSFFLSNQRTARRKLAEMMIATELERRFTKQQILEVYVNQVDMGQHGSFNIRGFGEAAQIYFGKEIKKVTLPEAATLAGIVNGPSYFSPYLHPDRAVHRRNIVLQAMYGNDVNGKRMISQGEMLRAKATPLKLAPPDAEADEAPYYIDLVRSRLLDDYSEAEINNSGLKVYTSLDPQLQKAAAEAIAAGMKRVDRLTKSGKAQVALVALDPHTGEVLALSGGRNYGVSQLNHATSKRPTGSIFKPFVYATALTSGLSNSLDKEVTGEKQDAYTEISMIDTAAGQFGAPGEKPYSPRNFDSRETGGEVTLRAALAHSINTATVRLAEHIGYGNVASLANSAGMDVKPTPSMAIGSYDATPLQMAGAYTTFANNGVYLEPRWIRGVQRSDGSIDRKPASAEEKILDPRVAFVVTDMLQAVMTEGTAASAVHGRFSRPAAGKTGTSHDAWFAGYTSNLLCVIWVGYDDYTDIRMEGGKAAAPIWVDFMARAARLRRYRNMQPFTPPDGVRQVAIDKLTNLPATDKCADDYQAFFIDGTIPRANCEHPEGDTRNAFQKMFGLGDKGGTLPPKNEDVTGTPKEKGFWKRLFRGKDKPAPPPPSPPLR